MKQAKALVTLLPLLGGSLVGCGSSQPEGMTKAQEDEVRHPTHIPPPEYKGAAGGSVSKPSGGPGGAASAPGAAPSGG